MGFWFFRNMNASNDSMMYMIRFFMGLSPSHKVLLYRHAWEVKEMNDLPRKALS